MNDLLSYDDDHFISRKSPLRHAFLKKWTHLPGGATYVARDVISRHVIGYGCRRPCIAAGEQAVGPVYADCPAVATALLARLCADVPGESVIVDVW